MADKATFTYESDCLATVAKHLDADPPNVELARRELADGLAHAFRATWREEERNESWLVAACAELLKTDAGR